MDLGQPCLLAVAHITGNTDSDFFTVTNYDANGESIDLLVNTLDPYDGYRPLDWLDRQCTAMFEVQAVGPWTIEILPYARFWANTAWHLSVPGVLEGNGDTILVLDGEPRRATITGNEVGDFFAVFAWSERGPDLLVNEIDPYTGTVLVGKNTFGLEIQAIGPWTISLE